MPTNRNVLTALAAVSASAIAAWLSAELVDARASHRGLGTSRAPAARHESRHGLRHSPGAPHPETGRHETGHTDAVVVLGYRNRGEHANFVNRFRVRAGIRSLDPAAARSVLVLCGGAVGGPTPEATIMQRCARDVLGFRGDIVVDTDSRSTWQNIANAIPHIEHADTIKIVSNAPHAEMGRDILWRQRPDLAARVVRGAEHRFGEAPLLKILGALRAVHSRLTGAWRTATEPRV